MIYDKNNAQELIERCKLSMPEVYVADTLEELEKKPRLARRLNFASLNKKGAYKAPETKPQQLYFLQGKNMEEIKKGRGGAGRGQGRKPTGRKIIYETFSISVLPEEKIEIKKRAKDAKKTVSRYLVDLVFLT